MQLNTKLPIRLVQNKIVRYPGGREIDRFRGIDPPMDDGRPEAWVASTAVVVQALEQGGTDGLAEIVTLDGSKVFLRDALKEYASELLGERHCLEAGNDTAVLVKLLDAQYQLGLQTHPTRAYAKEQYGFSYGKEECWYILSLREDSSEQPYVYLGFKPEITREAFEDAYRKGDVPAMEAFCHKIPVQPGEMYYVGAGVPHAVGCGCFLIEVQEPSDITVGPRIPSSLAGQEREDFIARSLGCFHYDGADYEDNLARYRVVPHEIKATDHGREIVLIGKEQTPYFSAASVTCTGSFSPRSCDTFAVALVVKGTGKIITQTGSVDYAKADEWFLPAAMGDFMIEPAEDTQIVLCYPPTAPW